jgi:hypothetical protein
MHRYIGAYVIHVYIHSYLEIFFVLLFLYFNQLSITVFKCYTAHWLSVTFHHTCWFAASSGVGVFCFIILSTSLFHYILHVPFLFSLSVLILNYLLLTLWNRVLLEKLIGSQLLWTRRFIITFTSAHHLSLSSKELVQFVGMCVCFMTASFYGEELSAPCLTSKLEDHHLLAVCVCLFNTFETTLHIGYCSLTWQNWCSETHTLLRA